MNLLPLSFPTSRLLALLFFPFVFLTGCTSKPQGDKDKPPSKPNIVWIMAEDMGKDLAVYGTKGVKTPYLDQMASEGILFQNCFVPNPICSTSRTAMMTAMHQTRIGAHHHRSNRELALPDSIKPITYYLRENGYTCILGHPEVFGKGRKLDCNFKHNATGPYDGKSQFGLFDTTTRWSPAVEPFFAQITMNVTHRGDWWKEKRANSSHKVDPSEVEIPPYMPDHPKIREQWATYLDQVEFMDQQVGMVVEDLANQGLLENTIIFFIGDNGRCEIRGKGYLYEPGINIPFIAWGAGISQEVNMDIVATMDISATILHLAGVEFPGHIQARPILGEKAHQTREYMYAARDGWDEINECSRAIRTPTFKYIKNYLPELPYDQHQAYLDFHRPAIHIMRNLDKEGKLEGPTTLFMVDSKPKEELYDLENDPHELQNLAGNPQYQAILEKMRSHMVDWQSKYPDTGLADLGHRNLRLSRAGKVRDYLQAEAPDEWENLLKGEICDFYGERVREVYRK